MDDQTKALVDDALKNHPNASIQVININTPGTVIVIGGNYFGNNYSRKKQETQQKEEVESSVEVLDTSSKEGVVIDSTPVNERSASTELHEVEESVAKAAKKIIAESDSLINCFAEKPFNDIVKGISQKGIAQQIIDAADADAIDSILDQHFSDAPF